MSRCQAEQRRPTPVPCHSSASALLWGWERAPACPQDVLPSQGNSKAQENGKCGQLPACCGLAGQTPPRGAPTFFFSFFFSAFLFIRSSSATSSRAFLSASWGSDAVSTSAWHRATARRAGQPRVWATLPAPSHPPQGDGRRGTGGCDRAEVGAPSGAETGSRQAAHGQGGCLHLGCKLVPPGRRQPVHLHLQSAWRGLSGQSPLVQERALEPAEVVGGVAVLARNVPVLAKVYPLLFILIILPAGLLQPAGVVPEARACTGRTGAVSGGSRAPGPPAAPPSAPPGDSSRLTAAEDGPGPGRFPHRDGLRRHRQLQRRRRRCLPRGSSRPREPAPGPSPRRPPTYLPLAMLGLGGAGQAVPGAEGRCGERRQPSAVGNETETRRRGGGRAPPALPPPPPQPSPAPGTPSPPHRALAPAGRLTARLPSLRDPVPGPAGPAPGSPGPLPAPYRRSSRRGRAHSPRDRRRGRPPTWRRPGPARPGPASRPPPASPRAAAAGSGAGRGPEVGREADRKWGMAPAEAARPPCWVRAGRRPARPAPSSTGAPRPRPPSPPPLKPRVRPPSAAQDHPPASTGDGGADLAAGQPCPFLRISAGAA